MEPKLGLELGLKVDTELDPEIEPLAMLTPVLAFSDPAKGPVQAG